MENSFKQKYPEACLAKCLLIALDKKDSEAKKELNILLSALKFDRENFIIGHLQKIIEDYNCKVEWYVDSKIYYDFVRKRKISNRISLLLKRINIKTIDYLLKEKKLIIYLDQYYLWEKKFGRYYKYHYPHFVVVLKRIEDKYKIIDPNTGKIKFVSGFILDKAIKSLRKSLKFSPHIIAVKTGERK